GAKIDLQEITQEIFEDPKLDGRTYEAKAIKKIMVENGFTYKTTKIQKDKKLPFRLTDEQKVFIENNCNNMSTLELANHLFEEEGLTVHDERVRIIQTYLNTSTTKIKQADNSINAAKVTTYVKPKTISRVLPKINNFCNQ